MKSREAKRVEKAEQQPQEEGYSDEFYTPERYHSPLGPFALDSCAGPKRLATINFNFAEGQDGLVLSWREAVQRHYGIPFREIPLHLILAWVNPPYSLKAEFLELLARYGHGFALVPNSTESIWWQRAANQCTAFCLLKGRVPFIGPDGRELKANTKGSTIFAYGQEAADRLKKAVREGKLKGRICPGGPSF